VISHPSTDPAPLPPDFLQSYLDYVYSHPLSQDTATQAESSRSSSHAEPSSSGSPSTHKNTLPLDEYLDLESDSSDEEMEEIAPGDPSATTTTSALAPRMRQAVEVERCLWQGCCTEFEIGVHYKVWIYHVKLAHVVQQDERGNRRPGAIKCQWDGCGRKFKSQGILKHMSTHLQEV